MYIATVANTVLCTMEDMSTIVISLDYVILLAKLSFKNTALTNKRSPK